MLGVGNAESLKSLWSCADHKASLPIAPEQFFALSGEMEEQRNCQRAYKRYYLRRKALVERGDESYGIFLLDCSRMGMGLISPKQLFPRERILLHLENRRSYQLEVRRCQRIAEDCYKCGTIFILNS